MAEIVPRPVYRQEIVTKLKHFPIVSVLGARQVGKTTLARLVAADRQAEFFDLEDPRAAARLRAPMLTLEPLRGLVIIDEIQVMPDLYPVLRVLADRDPPPARFLLLGSAAPSLVRGVSETLAGRVSFVDVEGFDLSEIGVQRFEPLWLRGGLPDSMLAPSEVVSYQWREAYIRTFLQRDLPQLGVNVPGTTMRRFWTMLAHYHGQVWNAAELARTLGASEPTARRYLDVLTSAYMVRQLPPWHENLRKRQVKSPKIYLRDTGLLHALLTITDKAALQSHPKLGASWEGFAIEQALRVIRPHDAYFWGTHAGAELDLLLLIGGKRYGVEVKYTDAPRVTKSMQIALADLSLEHLFVIYPGAQTFPLADRITAKAVTELTDWPLP